MVTLKENDIRNFYFEGQTLRLDLSCKYRSKPNAVVMQLYCDEGPWATLSVCLGDKNIQPNQAYIDNNNFPEALDALIDQGIVKLLEKQRVSGYCTYPLVEVLS